MCGFGVGRVEKWNGVVSLGRPCYRFIEVLLDDDRSMTRVSTVWTVAGEMAGDRPHRFDEWINDKSLGRHLGSDHVVD